MAAISSLFHRRRSFHLLSLPKVGTDYQVRSKTVGDPLQGKTITLTHMLEDEIGRSTLAWTAQGRRRHAGRERCATPPGSPREGFTDAPFGRDAD